MVQSLFVLVVLLGITYWLVPRVTRNHPGIQPGHVYALFFYHYVLSFVYYLYALFNPSDSKVYYLKVLRDFRGPDWGSFYGVSTTFIEFLGYPLIRFFGFTYESVMVTFSYAGFLGFVVYLIFLFEQVRFKPVILGVDARLFVLFLPNFHFWTSSFGKGSIIFLGIGLVIFALSKLTTRYGWMILGLLITYHVRPHIMFVLLISILLGFLLTGKRVPLAQKLVVVGLAAVALFFVYEDVLVITGLDEDFLESTASLSERAADLQRATSGVDISRYNFVEKLFTFLYRPLFFDAPGALGFFVSIENVVYLALTLYLFQSGALRFLWNSDVLVKTSLFAFLTVSIALAQISSNLGLAIRQKSQVMMLLLFIIIRFLDVKKAARWRVAERKKRLRSMASL